MNDLTTTAEQPREATTSAALVLNSASMDSMMRVAEMMSSGKTTVPKHLQNSPADCLAVTMQAIQWQLNPFAVAQKTHLVNGTLGYEAQLVNAVVQSSNSIVGAFSYEYEGKSPSLNCRVGAVLRGGSTITWGQWLCENAVTTKNSPVWKTNPSQQLGYLQVKNWARLYCPGAILGVYTPDELTTPITKDMGRVQVVPAAAIEESAPANLVLAAETAASLGMASYQDYWKSATADNRKLLKGEHERLKALAVESDKSRTIDNATLRAAPSKASQTTGEITYSAVMEKLQKAGDVDALDIAADWIKSVDCEDLQTELTGKYQLLRASLE
jgi:RecT family